VQSGRGATVVGRRDADATEADAKLPVGRWRALYKRVTGSIVNSRTISSREGVRPHSPHEQLEAYPSTRTSASLASTRTLTSVLRSTL
jgi:hypothetical protein